MCCMYMTLAWKECNSDELLYLTVMLFSKNHLISLSSERFRGKNMKNSFFFTGEVSQILAGVVLVVFHHVTIVASVVVVYHVTIVAIGHGLLKKCWPFGTRLLSTHCSEFLLDTIVSQLLPHPGHE